MVAKNGARQTKKSKKSTISASCDLARAKLVGYTGRPAMSNRALWNVRRRHESLTKPLKAKRLKKRSRTRIGLQAAIDRRVGTPVPTEG